MKVAWRVRVKFPSGVEVDYDPFDELPQSVTNPTDRIEVTRIAPVGVATTKGLNPIFMPKAR